MRTVLKISVLALAGSVAASAALAGGFSRGSADTDIIYEDGGVDMRSSLSFIAPRRGYDTINGAAATDGSYTDNFAIMGSAVKFNITNNLRCAGTFAQPYGAKQTSGPQSISADIADAIAGGNFTTPSGTESVTMTVNELGATCGVKFDAGIGNVWVLGGIHMQNIKYEEAKRIGNATAGPVGTLKLSESAVPGYRLGIAFEKEEIALRVQGMYVSGTEFNLDGTFDVNGVVRNPAATGSANFPQSFEIKAQSGIAENWLAFGSVKWTDWSAFDVLKFTATTPDTKEFFYKDGWTVSAGLGHKINETLSVSGSLTWDQGVGTTEDISTDTYSLAAGAILNGENGSQLRLGGSISYLTSGSVAKSATAGGKGAGGSFAATAGNDIAVGLGGSFKFSF